MYSLLLLFLIFPSNIFLSFHSRTFTIPSLAFIISFSSSFHNSVRCCVDPLQKVLTHDAEPEGLQLAVHGARNSTWIGLLPYVKIRRLFLCSFILQNPIFLEIKSVMVCTLWANLYDIKIRRDWKVAIFQLLFNRNWNHFFKAYICGIVKFSVILKDRLDV